MNDFSEIIAFAKSNKKIKIIPQKINDNIKTYLSSLDNGQFNSIEDLCKNLPFSNEKQLLINHINHIINCFSLIKPISNFKFEISNKNSCQIFHQDYLDIRAIVTYLGPGTEFVEDSNINFEFVEMTWHDPQDHNNNLIKDKSLIYYANTNDICFLKGKTGENYGQFHRSPEIEKFNLKRAVLILN